MLLPIFYSRNSCDVAHDLLGQILVRVLPDGSRLAGLIIETEAYRQYDLASHSYRGKTQRNASMFLAAGYAYVYFIYGMYYCLNVVTEDEGVGAAVLIRALQPLAGLPKMRAIYPNQPDHKLCNGPGKVCKVFGIDKSFDGCDLISNTHGLFIEAGKDIPFDMIKATPRIGISGDDEARNVLWRWYVLPSALNDLHIKSFL